MTKRITTAILLFLPFLLHTQNLTKEDVATCIMEIMELDRMQPYLQFQEEEFGEIIIPLNNQKNVNPRNANRIAEQFTDEDFYDAYFKVAVLDDFQVKNRNLNPQKLMTWGWSFRGEQILINLGGWREDTQQILRAHFLFEKNNEDWELINQDYNERR